MNNKKIKSIIKSGIDLEFEDISDKLKNYDYKSTNKNHRIFKLCICLSCIIILISISFHLFNPTNKIYINNINYFENTNALYDGMYKYSVHELNENAYQPSKEELLKKYKINLNSKNISDIICIYNQNKEEQCNIKYIKDSNLIYVNIKKDTLPTFTNESYDNWYKNTNNRNFKISTINNKKLIIIKNNNSQTFIEDYINKNTSNFRTKFMLNDTGVAIEYYGVNIDKFINFINQISR